MSQRGAFGVFVDDLRRSTRAVLSDRRFLALSTAVGVTGYVLQLVPYEKQQLVGLLSLPISIFYLGYVGTERIWFARLFHGETLDRAGIWSWTWHLFPRYLRLGFIVLLIMSPLIVWISVEVFRVAGELIAEMQRTGRAEQLDPQEFSERLYAPTFIVASAAIAVVADFLLTFTTPALAFTHSKAWSALKENFRTMRAGWPTSLLYVLIPPFAALVTLRLLPVTRLGSGLYVALAVLGVLLNLLFKGATVAFYLRLHPTQDARDQVPGEDPA